METHHRKQCVRYNIPGHAHELTFSCFQQRRFLSSKKACSYLAEAITTSKLKYNFHVWAYVFMPEHVHILILPLNNDYSISNILASIKQSSSRRILNDLRKHKPEKLAPFMTGQKNRLYRFWQDGGGYDRNIIKVSTLKKVVDYIHGNPVRKGLAETPEQWKWSSAGFWLSKTVGEIPVDKDSFPI